MEVERIVADQIWHRVAAAVPLRCNSQTPSLPSENFGDWYQTMSVPCAKQRDDFCRALRASFRPDRALQHLRGRE